MSEVLSRLEEPDQAGMRMDVVHGRGGDCHKSQTGAERDSSCPLLGYWVSLEQHMTPTRFSTHSGLTNVE